MAILPVLELPNPMLRRRAKKVRRIDKSVLKLAYSMVERMQDANGVGLAANTGGGPARSLEDERLALEASQEKLKTLLADSNAPEPLVHPNLAEVYRRKVANLNESLQQEDTKAEAAEIIRNLVDEIVLVPENGHLRIDLKGELASILSFASDKKKPATHVGDGLEHIKMVAGARNHPYRTNLIWLRSTA